MQVFQRNDREGISEFNLELEGIKNVKTLIVVNDHTRKTPTHLILPKILEKIDRDNITILFATGIHRAPTKNERIKILGGNFRCSSHNSLNSKFIYLGKTSFSTPVEINDIFKKYSQRIVIGSVEPHYFAGYTGGRKSLLPGIASYKAIENNHKMAISEEARALKLHGNPVAEDMWEFAEIVAEKFDFFSIQLVASSTKIYAVASGDIFESFKKLLSVADEIYTVYISRKFEGCIAEVDYPYSLNFYQATKALESAVLFTKEGGKILLSADCSEGLGEGRFTQILMGKKFKHYKVGDHKAYRIKKMLEKYEIYVDSKLPDNIVRKMGFIPIKKDEFISLCGDLCVVKDAVNTFPKI